MSNPSLGAPGVLLVLLSRGVTSTRVLVRSEEGQAIPFAHAAARPGLGQLTLARELCPRQRPGRTP
ncbi:MAG: hypothetical protein AAGC67_22115, partial [Myxococcota bacterium]